MDNFCYFYIKFYVVGTQNQHAKMILMSTHNMFLWRTLENYPLIILKYPHLFH